MTEDNLKKVRAALPEGVRLVAVSKHHGPQTIMQAYRAGQRLFGENLVQEMEAKRRLLPQDIEWHFIGHLQTNKVKYIAPYVSLIHSVDSLRLLSEVSRQAARAGRTIDCLLQIHIAREETKYGLTYDECRRMLADGAWKLLPGARICGLMGMATNTPDTAQIRREFGSLRDFMEEMRREHFARAPWFRELSMGMSHDYPEAVAAGSTLVRVGSLIFGERDGAAPRG